MNEFLWILTATIINTLLGLIGLTFFWIKDKVLNNLTIYLVAFSAGSILGGAFFHLLQDSFSFLPVSSAINFVFIGLITFMLIEGYFHWHHCKKCSHPFTYMMLIGDSVHNFIDGLIIAASFLLDIRLGIITTILIIIHELPQEIGLFGVLLHGKHSKKKALIYSVLAQSTCLIGGVFGFLISNKINLFSEHLIPFAAGGFIYIATADLIPELYKMHEGNLIKALKTLIPFFLGISLMILLKIWA
ncbi:MAG: ZIP family metal transporter [Nanoarchaeota archaeon]|nr:ZIP family metal transporter [Nanoarchaeota archaeon]